MSDDVSTAVAPPTADITPDPLSAKLHEYGASDEAVGKIRDDLGVDTLDDLGLLTEKDLVDAGLKTVQARKLIASLKPVTPVAETTALGAVAFDSVLPSVPDESSWLEALRAGGVLKVDQSTVISAIRAALANRVGLYDVPSKLVGAMELFADANDEQVDPVFFKLRQQLTRRAYGDIFSAIPGLDGSYVTEARKKQLFERMDRHLWPAILDFSTQLKSWQETWLQQGANPTMLLAALANMGGGGTALPPGMMQPPDTSTLRDYADGVNDAINRVFAGTGVQIAAALAYDAAQIRRTLEDPRLPSLIGVANREQMLKTLGIAVSSAYPRLETNLTRFVLACMQAKDQPAGNEELQYFGTLQMLGTQIPWTELGGGRRTTVTGIGGRDFSTL
jgi:hypothetical protein